MKGFFILCTVFAIVGHVLTEEEIDYEELLAREVENLESDKDDQDIIPPPPGPVSDVSSVEFESEPLRSDYNDQELAFINSLQAMAEGSNRRKPVRFNFNPRCYLENWTAACCINFNVTVPKQDPYECKTCIETGLKLDTMQAFAALYFDDHELFEKDFNIGKICWPLPKPLSKIKACYWVYHLDINFKDHRFESCSLLEITPYFHVGFNCLLFENGTFSIHDRILPEHKGLLDVELVGGKLKFEIQSPLGKKIKYWFQKQWRKFKGLFRKKSTKFIAWLRRKH